MLLSHTVCISVFYYHYCIFYLCICKSCIGISWQVELERGGEVWMLKSGEWGGGIQLYTER